ncbi:Azurocidin [Trichinella spiralis]|uniref:Azurocidin n=1 Tax=Trichinella spiralis TaxID=6334 RepID=A0ABR3KBI3_TRISP
MYIPYFIFVISILQASVEGRWLCGQQNQRMLEDSLNQNSDKPLPPHEASWIVMIESGGKTCIGHIVGSPATTKVQIVLTTRDCVEGKSASSIKVYRKTETSKAAKILKVHSVKQHSYLKELSILKLKIQ